MASSRTADETNIYKRQYAAPPNASLSATGSVTHRYGTRRAAKSSVQREVEQVVNAMDAQLQDDAEMARMQRRFGSKSANTRQRQADDEDDDDNEDEDGYGFDYGLDDSEDIEVASVSEETEKDSDELTDDESAEESKDN